VPDSLQTIIFPVLQEAMNNIAKHSKANQVLVALWETEQAIQLVVRDNGHGIIMEDIPSRKDQAGHGERFFALLRMTCSDSYDPLRNCHM